MTIRLYDSHARRKDDLPPPPGPIGMYFCGPTVYQRIHIGNARPFVLSMWLKRWLEHRGYTVKLAENVTDINVKIYDAARPYGSGSSELERGARAW
jgi:cysteinyl-tRNA synthetase